nr:transient receptor potential cation channel subfamily A member 1-10 [Apostichopus japonicus]
MYASITTNDRQKLLTLLDKEGNTALHAAVNSGDLRTVEVCLDNGSQIDVQQCDMLTPLHLACSQGALEMVRAMLSKADDPFTVLGLRDVQKQTPLHKRKIFIRTQSALNGVWLSIDMYIMQKRRYYFTDGAAMFDHHDVVAIILNEGCDIDAVDRKQCTPLLLATARGAWRSVQLLLENNSDLTCSDSGNRNVLHLSVLNGGNLEFFGAEFFKRTDALELLNQADCAGCTPMHYATQQGNLKSVQGLIDLGARVNLKNKEKSHLSILRHGTYITQLHSTCIGLNYDIFFNSALKRERQNIYSNRYGRLNSCKRLLDSPIGPHILNESDGEGRTALHIAAANGHTKFAQLLLRRGSLLHK